MSGASTCHRYSGLRTLPLKPDEAHSLSTGDCEFLVLPLTGSRTVTTDGSAFELTSRTDVFASTTDSDSAYLSRSSEALISSADGGTFALPSARTERSSLSARYGPKENVPVELSGAGASSRQVDNHCLPGTVGALDKAMAVANANPYCRQQHRLAHRLR
ncbi:5-deoxy-glucuronate isomerase [Streptomyces galilaeus]